jgi:hypothetical protein
MRLFLTPHTHETSPNGAPWICSCTHPSLFDIGVGASRGDGRAGARFKF